MIGSADAAGRATVKHGKAIVTLTCNGAGTCSGTLELVAEITTKRVVRRHHKRQVIKREQKLMLGEASFSIPPGVSAVAPVRLSGKGKKLVREAGRKGLDVTLSGSGVKTRRLVFEQAGPKRRPRGKHAHGARALR